MTEKRRSGIVVGYVACMSLATFVFAVANEINDTTLPQDTALRTFYVTLGLSQVCLVAVWLAIGQARFALRLLVAIVISVGWSALLERYASEQFEVMCAAFSLLMVSTAFILVVARLLSRYRAQREYSKPTVQYSLSEMFGGLLLAAIVLLPVRHGIQSRVDALFLAILVPAFALSSSALTWAIFGEKRPLLSFGYFIIAALGAFLVIHYWAFSRVYVFSGIWVLLKYNAIVCCIVGASLMIFRGLGYRLDQAGVLCLPRVE